MKKTKRVVRSITVQLYQKHSDIIDRIQEDEDISGRIRTLILEYGEKAFPETPAYAEAMKMRAEAKQKEADLEKEIINMSNEEYCSKILGGKVTKDGEACGFLASNGTITRIRLNTIKNHKADELYPTIHKELMNKTFVYGDGKVINDSQWNDLQKTLAEV